MVREIPTYTDLEDQFIAKVKAFYNQQNGRIKSADRVPCPGCNKVIADGDRCEEMKLLVHQSTRDRVKQVLQEYTNHSAVRNVPGSNRRSVDALQRVAPHNRIVRYMLEHVVLFNNNNNNNNTNVHQIQSQNGLASIQMDPLSVSPLLFGILRDGTKGDRLWMVFNRQVKKFCLFSNKLFDFKGGRSWRAAAIKRRASWSFAPFFNNQTKQLLDETACADEYMVFDDDSKIEDPDK